MVNVAETGHQPGFAMVDFGMVCHQPVLCAGGQHGALHVSIGLLAGAQPQPGMKRAGAENGDVGPVAGDVGLVGLSARPTFADLHHHRL